MLLESAVSSLCLQVQVGWTILKIDGRPAPGSFDATLMMLQSCLVSHSARMLVSCFMDRYASLDDLSKSSLLLRALASTAKEATRDEASLTLIELMKSDLMGVLTAIANSATSHNCIFMQHNAFRKLPWQAILTGLHDTGS